LNINDTLYSGGSAGEVFQLQGGATIGGIDSGFINMTFINVNANGRIASGNYPTGVDIASIGSTVFKFGSFQYGYAEKMNNRGNYDSLYVSVLVLEHHLLIS
jgi:hypothetical protein